MKIVKSAAVLLLASAMLFPTLASAGNCKNVDIKIENSTGGQIKIKKIWHYDFGKGKWRTNSTTNRKISNNYSRTYTKDLQYVKNEPTQVAIFYHQYDINIDRWFNSSTFTCIKNGNITIDIDAPGTMAIFEAPPMEGRPIATF